LNCDRIAPWYRWLEYAAFGGALRKRREAFLFELGNPQKVLVLGDGDGRFLQVFTALYPQARVDAVDASARMIELASARAPSVTFHLADAREFPFDQEYDLAVAHFFFDCFDDQELAQLLQRIHAKTWLVSEFRNTRWSWPILRALYFFFRLTTSLSVRTLPDHHAALAQLGFRMEKEQSAASGLLASELWVRTLEPRPAGAVNPERRSILPTPAKPVPS
jgi:ubiquinone/menaquinone biosynthesis C-methylase UbiE